MNTHKGKKTFQNLWKNSKENLILKMGICSDIYSLDISMIQKLKKGFMKEVMKSLKCWQVYTN